MTVYDLTKHAECSLPENAAVALGNFDGVHIGHRRLFDALAAVVVIMLVTKKMGPPCYSYEELKSMGYSDYQAKKLLQRTVSF